MRSQAPAGSEGAREVASRISLAGASSSLTRLPLKACLQLQSRALLFQKYHPSFLSQSSSSGWCGSKGSKESSKERCVRAQGSSQAQSSSLASLFSLPSLVPTDAQRTQVHHSQRAILFSSDKQHNGGGTEDAFLYQRTSPSSSDRRLWPALPPSSPSSTSATTTFTSVPSPSPSFLP